jgi:hypothetical protein
MRSVLLQHTFTTGLEEARAADQRLVVLIGRVGRDAGTLHTHANEQTHGWEGA